MELLLAMVMTALIGAAVFAALNQGITVWQRANREDPNLEYGIFLEKLNQDLRNMISYGADGLKGEQNELEFYSAVSRPGVLQTKENPKKIRYYYHSQKQAIMREVTEYPDLSRKSQKAVQASVVLEKIREFSLTYLKIRDHRELLWLKYWNDGCLPSALKVSLKSIDEKKPVVMKMVQIPVGGC